MLRALAVLLVLGRHAEPCPVETSGFLHGVTSVWAAGGWVGVDLFFVLSGFLVSGLLFREYEKHGRLRIGDFLIRRGFKIYPAFWLLIAVTVFLRSRHANEMTPAKIGAELLFVQNYFPGLWYHTWSLAVEEHFYLLLALGFFVLARRRSSRPFAAVPWAFGTTALLCLALRVINSARHPFAIGTHVTPTHLRLDSLAYGVFLSYLFHHWPVRFLAFARQFRYPLLAVGILLLLPAFCVPLETRFIATGGFTMFYLGSGCLLVAALGLGPPSTALGRGIAFTGSHSYSIYLWHMEVAIFALLVGNHIHPVRYGWFGYATVFLIGSLGLGIFLATVIEYPVLRMRDRLFPLRGNPLAAKEAGASSPLQPDTVAA